MRKVKEVLRLKFDRGLEVRQIARSCSIPHTSVLNYLSRAKAAGLSWPLPEDLDDEALERRLFPGPSARPAGLIPKPDFSSIHQELRANRHVTLQLLWEEYKQNHPDGLPVQPLLRALRALGPQARPGAAPGLPGGREAVRGSCRARP